MSRPPLKPLDADATPPSLPPDKASRIPPQSARTANPPDGTLDCDPDPMGEIFAELQQEHIARARYFAYTPADVLKRDRERAGENDERKRLQTEELDHARALARIKTEARASQEPLPLTTIPTEIKSGSGSRRTLLLDAWTESKGIWLDYCRAVDRNGVPLKGAARHDYGVTTYEAAWQKGDQRLQKLLKDEIRNARNALSKKPLT